MLSLSFARFQGSVRTGLTRTGERIAEVRAQHVRRLTAPRVLAGPVRDVDQRDVGRAPVLVGRVMTQIGGDVGLHVRRPPRRRAASRPLRRTPPPATPWRRGRLRPAPPTTSRAVPRVDAGDEGRQRFRAGQCADATDADAGRAAAPARRRRRRVPRRGARRASPPAPPPRSPAGAMTSTRSSGTRSTAPTRADRRRRRRRAAGTARCPRRSSCSASSRRCARRPRRTAPSRTASASARRARTPPTCRDAMPLGYRRQHVLDDQPERLGQRVGHAGRGRVGVGVGGEQRTAATDQPVQQRALGGVRRDGVDTAQQQRVVGQQQTARRAPRRRRRRSRRRRS